MVRTVEKNPETPAYLKILDDAAELAIKSVWYDKDKLEEIRARLYQESEYIGRVYLGRQ